MQMSCFISSPSLHRLNPPKRPISVLPKAKLTQLQCLPSGSCPGENNLCFSFALLKSEVSSR